MPEGVLDVVAEDPQVEHVAADVEEAAVQEHRREYRQHGRRELHGHAARLDQAARDKTELQDELLAAAGSTWLAPRSKESLVEEDEWH